MRYFDGLFIEELKASLRDWDRKWHSRRARDYAERYEAMTAAQKEEGYELLTRMREAMTALDLLFRNPKGQ